MDKRLLVLASGMFAIDTDNFVVAGVLGVLETRLGVVAMMKGKIGPWMIGTADAFTIGDFDGDGRDEIYVRSAVYAGVFKWLD